MIIPLKTDKCPKCKRELRKVREYECECGTPIRRDGAKSYADLPRKEALAYSMLVEDRK